ncbi:hypothetical protein DY000_02028544 [Brassica cretica]|uniref:MATH domain-containing protein n=1 Tax=Brassica cretica TaxID=69181 RepID=A0ABQ7DJM2_BRACR|nr:hypothetical protein DY000_02028544 [Brassica cretica]
MWSQNPSFRLEIDNFSKKKDDILSKVFVAGGCEWFLYVYPKGDLHVDNHLSVYLRVANPKSLQIGWKRNASFYFVVLNHRNRERCISASNEVLSFHQLKEEGFMGKDSLIIEVYINVIEAVDGESEDVSEEETVDINDSQVSAFHVDLVKKIFAEHPDIALGFKPKNQVVKRAYVNVLLGLINTLNKPSESHSEAELLISQASCVSWKKWKRRWNLNLKRKVDEVLLERKKAKADEPRVGKLEERVKNLEVMESGFKMDCLKSKLEDVSLEKKKSDDADGSRVQQLEESVENLETMVSDLKAKLDEEKAKSSSDEFLLV